ncbi:hypothetical protein CASFOL_027279 [Castilleja foliolosa]|uniref:Uncharacterized protein n=1 Tax=Castilleja foliolosa TaxID=1961234 RepID=A0ABD3CF61_9LAMI
MYKDETERVAQACYPSEYKSAGGGGIQRSTRLA